jgi:hypothetical protein
VHVYVEKSIAYPSPLAVIGIDLFNAGSYFFLCRVVRALTTSQSSRQGNNDAESQSYPNPQWSSLARQEARELPRMRWHDTIQPGEEADRLRIMRAVLHP